ncbi:MAG: hypothetical protein AAFR98_12610 [Pseudomonadota bacterium]
MLFSVDPAKEIQIAGDVWWPAETQDAVEVYILKNDISTRTFGQEFGKPGIVFHTGYRLCEEIGCDKDNDNKTYQVYPGRAFIIEPDASNNASILKVDRGGRRVGVLTDSELSELRSNGSVTTFDQPHPRYFVTETNGFPFDTICDQVLGASNDNVALPLPLESAPPPELTAVFRAFQIGDILETNGTFSLGFKRPYGAEGLSIRHYLYKFHDTTTDNVFVFAVQVPMACSWNVSIQENKRINPVNLLRIDTASVNPSSDALEIPVTKRDGSQTAVAVDFETSVSSPVTLNGGETKDNLAGVHFGKHPYLWSVNTPTQYFELMKYISAKLNDRALAGFFLSKFNISCRETARSTEVPCYETDYSGLQ